ncbi:MAG TPA: tetratricopeptide repeat protein [Azospirillum sp.]|nr:tetratricopeptide repeat protein [Azospirillum sp.]
MTDSASRIVLGAVTLVQKGSLAEAEAVLRAGLPELPAHPALRHLLGVVVRDQRRYGEACDWLRTALVVKPDYAEAYANLGLAHKETGGLAAAAEALRRAVRLDPCNVNARVNLAVLSQFEGPARSAALLRQALCVRPDDRALLRRYAQVLALCGGPADIAEAGRVMRRVLAGAPDDAGAALMLATLVVGGPSALLELFNAWFKLLNAERRTNADLLSQRFGPLVRRDVLGLVGRAARKPLDEAGSAPRAARLLTVMGEPAAALRVLAAAPPGDPTHLQLMADIALPVEGRQTSLALYERFFAESCRGPAEPMPLGPGLADAVSARRVDPGAPPIIYVHFGNADYLKFSLAQSLRSNPRSRIIMLGDSANRYEHVEHHRLAAFMDRTRPVRAAYRHNSPNSYVYELFCVERWAILLEFCRRHGIREAFTLDSDVMPFLDFTENRAVFAGADIHFTENSGHFCHFTIDGLARFCAFLQGALEDGRYDAVSRYSDMTIVDDFRSVEPHGNLGIPRDGLVFDGNLRMAQGFRTGDGVKLIRFADGGAYGVLEDTGADVRFGTLHFQGKAKPLMAEAYAGRPLRALRQRVVAGVL